MAFTVSPLEFWRNPYLFIFLIFGALWIYAFRDVARKPLFLRRASLVVPLFILVHVGVAVLYEVRQMLPLSFIILPMALYSLFPPARSAPD